MANRGTFQKGDGRTRKKKGDVGAVKKSMREMVLQAFMDIGGVKEFAAWGKQEKNRAVFYQIVAKTIGLEVTGPNGTPLIPPPIYMASDAPAK